MTKLTKQEITATYRIFNRVNSLCNNYWRSKTVEQARRYASLNRWIMFPTNNLNSLREGTDYPIPNIYVATLNQAPIADNNGRVKGHLGVTCGNVDAMAYIARALTPRHVEFFIDSLNMMVGWTVSIEQKIKTVFEKNTPKYKQISAFEATTVTASEIRDAIQHSNQTLLKGGVAFYDDEPVLWCVTVFNVYIQTALSNYDKNVQVAFNFFKELNLIN